MMPKKWNLIASAKEIPLYLEYTHISTEYKQVVNWLENDDSHELVRELVRRETVSIFGTFLCLWRVKKNTFCSLLIKSALRDWLP